MFVQVVSFHVRWRQPWQGAVRVRVVWHRLIVVRVVMCHFGAGVVLNEIGRRDRRIVGVSFGKDEDRKVRLQNLPICGGSGESIGRLGGEPIMWSCLLHLFVCASSSVIFVGCKEAAAVVAPVMRNRHRLARLLGRYRMAERRYCWAGHLGSYGCRRKPFFTIVLLDSELRMI